MADVKEEMEEQQNTRLKRKAKAKERAYLLLLMRISSENYMPRSVGKLHKNHNSQLKAFNLEREFHD